MEVEVDEPVERLLVAQRLRGRRGGRSTARWAVWTRSEGSPRAANAVRHSAELARGDAPLEHLLDQAAGAEDHFVEVEAGQLREVPSSAWTTRAIRVIPSLAHAHVHAGG